MFAELLPFSIFCWKAVDIVIFLYGSTSSEALLFQLYKFTIKLWSGDECCVFAVYIV
jgi:hypothetical protein